MCIYRQEMVQGKTFSFGDFDLRATVGALHNRNTTTVTSTTTTTTTTTDNDNDDDQLAINNKDNRAIAITAKW